MSGRRPTGEVGRRADKSLMEVRPDPQGGDHVLGDLFTEPCARVVPLRYNVGQAVVVYDLNPNIRIVR